MGGSGPNYNQQGSNGGSNNGYPASASSSLDAVLSSSAEYGDYDYPASTGCGSSGCGGGGSAGCGSGGCGGGAEEQSFGGIQPRKGGYGRKKRHVSKILV